MNCPHCSELIDSNSAFCQWCGAKMDPGLVKEEEKQATAYTERLERKGHYKRPIIFVLASILLVIAGTKVIQTLMPKTHIAFYSAKAKGIVIMNSDGTNRSKRVGPKHSKVHYSGPKLSPDGMKTAFGYRDQEAHVNIYVGDLAGRKIGNVKLDGGSSVPTPAWSPDSKRIAFNDLNAIFVMKPDGKNKKKITGDFNHNAPSWSPNGRKIVVQDYGFGSYGYGARSSYLEIYSSSKKRQEDATNYFQNLDPGDPSWSPDGKRILFAGGGHIYSVKEDLH